MGLKLGTEEIKCINIFENITGANVIDCLKGDDKLTFVVEEKDVGLAIGRKGSNIKRMSKMSGKDIEVVGYTDDPEEFIKNMLRPITLNSFVISKKNNKRVATIEVPREKKGLVIGKSGKNIKRIRSLLNRHYDITDVQIK